MLWCWNFQIQKVLSYQQTTNNWYMSICMQYPQTANSEQHFWNQLHWTLLSLTYLVRRNISNMPHLPHTCMCRTNYMKCTCTYPCALSMHSHEVQLGIWIKAMMGTWSIRYANPWWGTHTSKSRYPNMTSNQSLMWGQWSHIHVQTLQEGQIHINTSLHKYNFKQLQQLWPNM